MTYVTANRNKATDLNIASGVYGILVRISALTQRFADYRVYRQTISQLSALSDHNLADLGLHRSGIAGVASTAVYGKRR